MAVILFFKLFNSVFFIETINTAIGSNEALFASIEWVTIGTGINLNVFSCAVGFEFATTGDACHFYFVNLWVNVFFHKSLTPSALGLKWLLKKVAR